MYIVPMFRSLHPLVLKKQISKCLSVAVVGSVQGNNKQFLTYYSGTGGYGVTWVTGFPIKQVFSHISTISGSNRLKFWGYT